MKVSDKLSQNFSIREVMASEKARELAIDNTPPVTLLPRIMAAAIGMERIRDYLGNYPVRVHSWYRCEALNRAVGGAKESAHLQGHAVDFSVQKFGTPRQVALMLELMIRDFKIDQLILEPAWVHVSFADAPRFEKLTASLENNRLVYRKGILRA